MRMQLFQLSGFLENGFAKEMPVLQDLNSRSRGTGISFAGNNNLPARFAEAYAEREKKSSLIFAIKICSFYRDRISMDSCENPGNSVCSRRNGRRCRYRLARSRTSPFHGGNAGSNPAGGTGNFKATRKSGFKIFGTRDANGKGVGETGVSPYRKVGPIGPPETERCPGSPAGAGRRSISRWRYSFTAIPFWR